MQGEGAAETYLQGEPASFLSTCRSDTQLTHKQPKLNAVSFHFTIRIKDNAVGREKTKSQNPQNTLWENLQTCFQKLKGLLWSVCLTGSEK